MENCDGVWRYLQSVETTILLNGYANASKHQTNNDLTRSMNIGQVQFVLVDNVNVTVIDEIRRIEDRSRLRIMVTGRMQSTNKHQGFIIR